MAHYKVSLSAREQFRRYLEKAGVVDSLTSVLVSLYEQPEKPNNALDLDRKQFVKQHLGAVGQTSADTEALQQEVMDLRQRCARLAEENKNLKTRLKRYEAVSEDGGTAN
uniref:MYC binding protein n=1 Tax=Amphilophus citrinellus TaxID=61819 RepID=A0A3Q0SGG5_AMPCI